MGALSDAWVQYRAEVEARLDLKKIFSDIQNAKPSGSGFMLGLCPFHDDHDPSFGFSTTTGCWECFAEGIKGGPFDYLMRRSGRSFKEVLVEMGDSLGLSRPARNDNGTQQVVYDYRDEVGTLLHQVLRGRGKKFHQRRPGGHGGWINDLKGVRRVLYRLPELLARPSETVFVAEGEKDADRLVSLGLLATTNSGGAEKWRPSYSEDLVGRDVVILPDNDEPGLRHAEMVAKSCRGKAKSVRVVLLPGLGPKQDVSDWLDAGGDREKLEALVTEAAEYESGSLEMAPDPDGRPVIQVNDRQQIEIFQDAWNALLGANDPPQLFVSNGFLARLAEGDINLSIELLDEAYAYGSLVRVADWVQIKGDKTIDAKPPRELARDLLSRPHPDLPMIEAVVAAPVFDANGRLILTPGYHRESRLWLRADAWIEHIRVPDEPTDADVADAVRLICQELLFDFPFVAESDEAHAVAAFILPFVRRIVAGTTPIHLIEAPTPGSGKGLLADLVSLVLLGEACEPTTITANEDESRKKLTAILSQGYPIISIDNVHEGLESGQLAAAITAMRWKDRLLGKSQMVVFPNRALWLVTANNPKLSMEIARRCARIRIEPKEERPWQRQGFKHDPIREWVLEHRPELVSAILTIVQSWIAAGMPPGTKVLGSFESWSRVIGGILHHAGITEFLQDAESFYDTADPESRQWRAFVHVWWQKYGGATVGVRELIALAEAHDLVAFAYAAKSEQSQRMRFGRALSALRGRRFGDLQVVVAEDSANKVNAYRVVAVERGLFDDKEQS
jgi:hypothetical protein